MGGGVEKAAGGVVAGGKVHSQWGCRAEQRPKEGKKISVK